MRPIIVLVLTALLVLGFFAIQYREDQEFLQQHLEQRDARNKEFNKRMDEVDRKNLGFSF